MDMMCSRCRKRPAVVFMSGMNGTQKFENGYCLKCAKELGIPQVDNYLKQMGISDIDFDNDSGLPFINGGVNGEDDDLDMDDLTDEELDALEDDDDDDGDEDRVDGFKAGGTMPAFFQRFFESPGKPAADSSSDTSGTKESTAESKERKDR